MTDIDKKASNEVKVGVKYKGVIEGRAAKADRNLGEFGGLCYKSHYGHNKLRVKWSTFSASTTKLKKYFQVVVIEFK